MNNTNFTGFSFSGGSTLVDFAVVRFVPVTEGGGVSGVGEISGVELAEVLGTASVLSPAGVGEGDRAA